MDIVFRTLYKNILKQWDDGKVIIVIGPRQVGKTTLISSIIDEKLLNKNEKYAFFNGDDAEDRILLENAGETKLRSIIGSANTVFVDEAQRIKDIGIILKIIHDQIKGVRVLVSGSSALDIANEINEPLTGRKWEYNLFPFSWNELKKHFGNIQNRKNIPFYMVYGCYPEVINHMNNAEAILKELSGSYLYKDLLQYQRIRKPEVLDRLLLALALQLGSEVNFNELSRTVGVDKATVEQYIILLEKAFVIFRIHPLSRNVRNEINTSRKIYFYDNGIRNAIIGNFKSIEFREDKGALWENYMISERIKMMSYTGWYGRKYFWRTYQQQEIDWIEEIDGQFSIYEFKWNAKKSKIKFPITFTSNYPINKMMVVTPENCDDFLN